MIVDSRTLDFDRELDVGIGEVDSQQLTTDRDRPLVLILRYRLSRAVMKMEPEDRVGGTVSNHHELEKAARPVVTPVRPGFASRATVA